jgi:DNA-binding transcriptional ArsR family regulator
MRSIAASTYGELARRSADAAGYLKLIANEKRLLVLCYLADREEATVMELEEVVGLSQSPLSQHLSRMRKEGLVSCRRDGLTMRYRIADPMTRKLLGALKKLFCPPHPKESSRDA